MSNFASTKDNIVLCSFLNDGKYFNSVSKHAFQFDDCRCLAEDCSALETHENRISYLNDDIIHKTVYSPHIAESKCTSHKST